MEEKDVIYNPVERAYTILVQAMYEEGDFVGKDVIEEVVGYLGEALA